MGYRGYDRTGKTPRYPFGYGLSYTDFEYSNLEVKKAGKSWSVSFDVTNTGDADGLETAQVYVSDVESSVLRPKKELKGYEKVFIRKGETVRVNVLLDRDAFSFYDTESKEFVLEPGDFTITAGPSSATLPLSVTVKIR